MQCALLKAAAMAVILTGCTSEPKYHATANDPKIEAEIVGSSHQGATVTLSRIDGQKVGTWKWQRGVTYFGQEDPILLDPGDRVLLVHCEADSLFVTRQASAQFDVTLKPAHIYQLRCERNDNAYSFWLEDQDAHRSVSDKQTVTNASTFGPWVATPPLPLKF
jgi:hypothetical protein